MGKRSRQHKQAVIEGKEPPFRASPGKPKVSEEKTAKAKDDFSKALGLLARVRKL